MNLFKHGWNPKAIDTAEFVQLVCNWNQACNERGMPTDEKVEHICHATRVEEGPKVTQDTGGGVALIQTK